MPFNRSICCFVTYNFSLVDPALDKNFKISVWNNSTFLCIQNNKIWYHNIVAWKKSCIFHEILFVLSTQAKFFAAYHSSILTKFDLSSELFRNYRSRVNCLSLILPFLTLIQIPYIDARDLDLSLIFKATLNHQFSIVPL